jgi:hypothetical protein
MERLFLAHVSVCDKVESPSLESSSSSIGVEVVSGLKWGKLEVLGQIHLATL